MNATGVGWPVSGSQSNYFKTRRAKARISLFATHVDDAGLLSGRTVTSVFDAKTSE
jgi:hypothetical protein